jgi:hypothetical protein
MRPEAACRPILRRLRACWCGAVPPPRSYATATARSDTPEILRMRQPRRRSSRPHTRAHRAWTGNVQGWIAHDPPDDPAGAEVLAAARRATAASRTTTCSNARLRPAGTRLHDDELDRSHTSRGSTEGLRYSSRRSDRCRERLRRSGSRQHHHTRVQRRGPCHAANRHGWHRDHMPVRGRNIPCCARQLPRARLALRRNGARLRPNDPRVVDRNQGQLYEPARRIRVVLGRRHEPADSARLVVVPEADARIDGSTHRLGSGHEGGGVEVQCLLVVAREQRERLGLKDGALRSYRPQTLESHRVSRIALA